jgi:Cu+-exporting ATPase
VVDASAARLRPGSGEPLFCPACGKGVDPLRAGHVAILAGRFQYYCGEACKRAHLRSIDEARSTDLPTVDPPLVVPSVASIVAEPTLETASMPPAEPEPAAGPITLRSPESQPASAARPVTMDPSAAHLPWARAVRAISVLGVISGVLAPSVALVGAAADSLRIPLAVVAAAAWLTRTALSPRDASDPDRLVTLVPVLGAVAAAVWARWAGDDRALALASFAGLAAAAALTVDVLLERVREPLIARRGRIARALDVQARVVRGEDTDLVAACDVKPGEQVAVETGETIPVDAVVAAGGAVVTPWLDASVEVEKGEGDPVVAGARVVKGRLRVTTTWAGHDRAWSRLALDPRLRADVASPLARIARLVADRGAPVAAVLVAIAVYAGNAGGPEVLAAACAAAVALGARGAVGMVALHLARGQLNALSHGIVYKDAASLDDAGRTGVGVLCARGTLLMGEPEIVALETFASLDIARVLTLAAGAETASTHPFAGAILRAAATHGVRPENVRSANVHAGLGVTALASTGERLVVGSRALLLEERVSVAIADARVTELEAQGRSVLLVALAGKLVALLALQDGLRPGARAAVQRLLDARLEPVLLSGEARETCETIGRALDIEHIRPEVLPADRGGEVRALGGGGHLVTVLGHPTSDDSALGAADVAVALNAAGATPGEWSVALASDDVRDAARAISIAHETRDRARVALALGVAPGILAALGVTFGFVPLVAAPLAALAGAVAALLHAKA